MGLIQRADLVERIRRAFAIRESGVGATMSPEIVPVVIVDDLTGPTIDEGYPRDCVCQVEAGASVGVMAESFLINRVGSSVDLIIKELWGRIGAPGGNLWIRTGVFASLNNMLGTQTYRSNLDRRVQLRPNSYVDSRNQAANVTGDTHLIYPVTQAVTYVFPLQFTLPPGTWLGIVPGTNNTSSALFVYYQERLRTNP